MASRVRSKESILAEQYAKRGIRLVLFDIFDPDEDLDGACIVPFLMHGSTVEDVDIRRFDTPVYRERMTLGGYEGPIELVSVSDDTERWVRGELPPTVCDFYISVPVQALLTIDDE